MWDCSRSFGGGLGYEVLVPQSPSGCPTCHCSDLVLGVQWSAIVAVLELSHVAVQVLPADLVERAHIGAVERGPEGFQAVGVGHAANVLADAMVDAIPCAVHPVVGTGLVGVDGSFVCCVLLDEGFESELLGVGGHLCADLVGLPVLEAEDGYLVHSSAAFMSVGRLPGAMPAPVLRPLIRRPGRRP